jgi:hypothetical protein
MTMYQLGTFDSLIYENNSLKNTFEEFFVVPKISEAFGGRVFKIVDSIRSPKLIQEAKQKSNCSISQFFLTILKIVLFATLFIPLLDLLCGLCTFLEMT